MIRYGMVWYALIMVGKYNIVRSGQSEYHIYRFPHVYICTYIHDVVKGKKAKQSKAKQSKARQSKAK